MGDAGPGREARSSFSCARFVEARSRSQEVGLRLAGVRFSRTSLSGGVGPVFSGRLRAGIGAVDHRGMIGDWTSRELNPSREVSKAPTATCEAKSYRGAPAGCSPPGASGARMVREFGPRVERHSRSTSAAESWAWRADGRGNSSGILE